MTGHHDAFKDAYEAKAAPKASQNPLRKIAKWLRDEVLFKNQNRQVRMIANHLSNSTNNIEENLQRHLMFAQTYGEENHERMA